MERGLRGREELKLSSRNEESGHGQQSASWGTLYTMRTSSLNQEISIDSKVSPEFKVTKHLYVGKNPFNHQSSVHSSLP